MAFIIVKDIIAMMRSTNQSSSAAYRFVGIIQRKVYFKGKGKNWVADIDDVLSKPGIYNLIPPTQYRVLQHLKEILKDGR